MSENFANESLFVFTDAATSSKKIIAVGAFVCLTKKILQEYASHNITNLQNLLAHQIIYTTYASKKSTWSEIQTVIDALSFAKNNFLLYKSLKIYTDCQSVCDLLGRRKAKLKANNFMTRSGKELAHAKLYKKLFLLADEFQIEMLKIKGHALVRDRVRVEERVFMVLDRLSRERLRDITWE